MRLKHAYFIKCESVVKDENGEVVELRCSYDPETRSGQAVNRKVKGTLHWVSAEHAIPAEVRLYSHLFTKENPGDEKANPDLKSCLNPESLEILTQCKLEPSLKTAEPGERFQFLRMGYFATDSVDFQAESLVFNRAATLRDTWAKIAKKSQ